MLVLLIGTITACNNVNVPDVDVNVLPEAGISVLDQEIRYGNLTQFEAPYSISSVHLADSDKVLDIYDAFYCVTVTPPIPQEEYSTTKYRHYSVIRTNSTWSANTEGTSAFAEWRRIGCPNWDD
jgi:hypothetical protein